MKRSAGLGLIEILLLVAVVFVLMGISILAVNPNKELAAARDEQRNIDTGIILNAIYQYSYDNRGIFPKTITSTPTEICKSSSMCAGLVDLSVLTNNEAYLIDFPSDPLSLTGNGTGYDVVLINGKIVVSAPQAEGITISVSK